MTNMTTFTCNLQLLDMNPMIKNNIIPKHY